MEYLVVQCATEIALHVSGLLISSYDSRFIVKLDVQIYLIFCAQVW